MGEKGRTTSIISIALLLILVLPVMNLTASNSYNYVIPVPQKSPIGDVIAGFPAGWSDDIRLTNNNEVDYQQTLAVDGDHIHVAWSKWLDPKWRIYYSSSNDSGQTWTNETEIGYIRKVPDITAEGGKVHLVSEDGTEIRYRNSSDGGESWNPEKMLSINDGYKSEAPKITMNGLNIHVFWIDSRNGSESSPTNTELYYKRSCDGGITWDDGLGNAGYDRRLTNAPYHTVPSGVNANGGSIHVLIDDERMGYMTSRVYYKRSLDNGATWDDGLGNINQDRLLTPNGTNHGSSTMAVDGNKIHIAWVDYVGESDYLYYRNSNDNGINWEPAKLLLGPLPVISSPDIAVEDNIISIVWADTRDLGGFNTEVYYINSTDGGVTWGSDIRLTYADEQSYGQKIIISNKTTHIVWNDNRTGGTAWNFEVYYKRFPDFPPDPTYNITLNEGWNLISTPLIQRNESINKVLENITGKWDVVKYYDTLDKNDPWKSYRVGSSMNDLLTIDNAMGFWIYINQPNVTLTVSGLIPSISTIPLYAGWNLVGYPTQTTQTVGNALWGTGADRVEVFDPVSPYIKEVGPTYIMKPGEGYWIHVPADTIWTINW